MKRKRSSATPLSVNKRACIETARAKVSTQTADILRQYYTNVCTLRQFLLCRLPATAKIRRRRLLKHGLDSSKPGSHDFSAEVDLLDRTLIGSHRYVPLDELDSIEQDLVHFTQLLSGSTAGPLASQQPLQQAEIVNFCIWKLLRSENRGAHLLCHGAQPYATDRAPDPQYQRTLSLKQHPWTILPGLLGHNGERVLCDMFLECGIFQPFESSSNMIQLSGRPLTDLKVVTRQDVKADNELAAMRPGVEPRVQAPQYCRLSDIRITRHRILYGRPEKWSNGKIRWSSGQTHVLRRCPNISNEAETVHVAKHIFPHQFGLQNVFTASNAQAAVKQSLRTHQDHEMEISKALDKMRAKEAPKVINDVRLKTLMPHRLRGEVIQLVQRIRNRHERAAFSNMLEHYCRKRTEASLDNSIALATPKSQVSAFVRAAVFDVFGAQCFGSKHNRRLLEVKLDHFVRLRRYENFSVHDLMDGMSIEEVKWLAPHGLKPGLRMSKSDFDKRKELLAEMLFFVFDSFVVPLIRGHFHVTESSSHRNRLFFFRHDTWTRMCEPAMQELKLSMLEECDTAVVKRITNRVNFIRLVPKERGMRPIINLRRRLGKPQQGTSAYGRSINTVLRPAFQAMNLEKSIRPGLAGDSMFSVRDMLSQLQALRKSLQDLDFLDAPLYFASIDVQACFDSLPQDKLMQLARTVLQQEEYAMKKYSKVSIISSNRKPTSGFGAKLSRRWMTVASECDKPLSLDDIISTDIDTGRTNAVYVDSRAQGRQSRVVMLKHLKEHIESNLISIGSRVYRQKQGIAQGSVVSSLLCNLLYAQLQRELLAFTNRPGTKLLRLIDDFLLITPDKQVAEQFMHTMHAGIAEYGVKVKGQKSLTNFDIAIDGLQISRLPSVASFPYCGYTINTSTLDLGKDIERAKKLNSADTVTVEHSRHPGQNFYLKTLHSLHILMHGMLISTTHNAIETVLGNLFNIFSGLAQKLHHYARSLPARSQPPGKLVIRAVDDAIKLAYKLVSHQAGKGSEDTVSTAHIRWLACKAFINVLQRRQTKHNILLAWLYKQMRSKTLSRLAIDLSPIVQKCM